MQQSKALPPRGDGSINKNFSPSIHEKRWKTWRPTCRAKREAGNFVASIMAKKNKNKFNSGRKDLRKEILNVFHSQPGKPLNHKQVSGALGIVDESLRSLVQELLAVGVAEGKLQEIEPGKYALLNKTPDVLQGTIEINRYGKGFVTIPGEKKDLEIPKGKTGVALYGDTVEIAFNSASGKKSGKVVRVIERGRKDYVGILQKTRNNYFVLPGDQRLQVEFFIAKNDLNHAEEGDKVVVELTRWDHPEQDPHGRIVKVLGRPGEHETEMHAIIAEFGLPYEFEEAVNKEADAIPNDITQEEIGKRRDFRDVVTFTIDPYDAKDFDDALSFRVLGNGNYEIGVHIADVSHYVKPGTLLDQEALNRATSVYLVDRTIPMLPEHISNFLCSLRPDEDKLCFSAVFELNEKAELKDEWFGRTVIRSQRRFTYEEAQEVIETKKGDLAKEILIIDGLAKQLREQRFRDGGIDFDTEEVKFQLNEKGDPIGVFVKRMKDSNRLIEDFMLLANRRVATFIGAPGKRVHPPSPVMPPKTFVYRVHDDPDPDKLTQLRTFLKNIGYKLPRPTDAASGNIIKELMSKVAGQPEESIIRQMAIRSMAKAEYSVNNVGHYGLAFEFYTHFTSPIRRYPDVMVHRLLQQYLDNGQSASESDYERMCRHSSLMEKRASDAERASIKYKQVEYMLHHLGEEFTGTISGLANWGIYVEVDESKSEGMVALQDMWGDSFDFDPDKYILQGRRTGQEFHLGDSIQVRIEGGDLQKRTLDFSWVGPGDTTRRKSRK